MPPDTAQIGEEEQGSNLHLTAPMPTVLLLDDLLRECAPD